MNQKKRSVLNQTMFKYQNNNKWEGKRKYILGRDGYECQECKRFGKCVTANTVHHIVPITADDRYSMLDENLISVCPKCHDSFHIRATQELTEKGVRLMKRHINKIEVAYAKKYSPHLKTANLD